MMILLMYEYGLIGNCQIAALVGSDGSVDWMCLPRPDSPPVFGKILDDRGGNFSISPAQKARGRQNYLPNTNILRTVFEDSEGSFEVLDFCPRFEQFGRLYRPTTLVRIVNPLRGSPAIRASCSPVIGWEKDPAKMTRGNSHLKFDMPQDLLRLTTNMPLTYLCEDQVFRLQESLYFVLTLGQAIEEDIATFSQDLLNKTDQYWRSWVKHCSIPTLFQRATIRSALTLKLHCFEDTGAILAALTTSLPEVTGHVRNWDYRFCWLRDAYFSLSAFHNLGHFEEMEGFLKYLLNLASEAENLRPVYKLDQSVPLPENEHSNWQGYLNSRPVRSNNQAAEHIQNDVYGELVLALSPIFFDERFHHLRTPEHAKLIKHLGSLCAKSLAAPDAGLWEVRGSLQEHSFTNLMCWSGLERLQRLAALGRVDQVKWDLTGALERARQAVLNGVKDGTLRNGPTDPSWDASLLLLPVLRFPDSELCRKTVEGVVSHLKAKQPISHPAFLYRYIRHDDFGTPESAFMICSFWLAMAYSKVGEVFLAQEILGQAVGASNHLGLLSEHYDPTTKRQYGNFPQAYSHVGVINAAFAVSPSWDTVL